MLDLINYCRVKLSNENKPSHDRKEVKLTTVVPSEERVTSADLCTCMSLSQEATGMCHVTTAETVSAGRSVSTAGWRTCSLAVHEGLHVRCDLLRVVDVLASSCRRHSCFTCIVLSVLAAAHKTLPVSFTFTVCGRTATCSCTQHFRCSEWRDFDLYQIS